MEIWQYFLLTGVGLAAGCINVIAGGGSLLTLPTMILMGMPEAVANGTNRVAILAQNLTAVTAFRKKGFSDFKMSLTLALCTVPGAIAGALCGTVIRGDLFNQILAVIMILVVILMAANSRKPKSNASDVKTDTPLTQQKLILGHLSMVGIGFYGGFIQAGVGFLIMAAFNGILNLDLVRVNMHKVFVIGFFTLAALVVFALAGKVWIIPGLALAVGNSVGGWIGSHLTIAKGETFVRWVLFVALISMAIKLLIG